MLAAIARVAGGNEGVVLNIQWPDGDVANNPDPGVNTNGRKPLTSGNAVTDAAPAETQRSAFKGLQQIAAKRNVFA